MRRMVFPLAMLSVLVAVAVPVAAPSPETDNEEVLAVLDRLFDGMRAGDTAVVRSTMHPSAQLVATGTRDGAPVVQVVQIDQFVASIGSATGELDEKFWNPIVQLRDNLATVWTTYAFYFDGEFSHCGVDAFTLARTAEGWKIVSVADTRQREGCEEPPG